jgi:23S rRNA (pseudouridine1915-N3)-methyltransferase
VLTAIRAVTPRPVFMKLRIVALGQRMPAWVDAAFDDYARRLPREFALELFEVKPEPRGRGRTVAQILAAEARRIAAATKGSRVVALDERGEAWTTTRLAERLRDWRDRGEAIVFVIGSADGIAEAIKRDADVIVALSALTLPHGLARVLLAEQIYRAVSLLTGHPYHRE